MILLINKPPGITSFDVIRRLRRKMGIRKMGHCGTLDPQASGLMIIATEKDTKKLSDFLKLGKEYEAEIEFGKTSNTYDSDGEIVEYRNAQNLNLAQIKKALKEFEGEIMQTPPAFSAKKIKGVPAYKLARKGKVFSLAPKKVVIRKIEILDFSWPVLKIRINCSSGTYVRSLAHDLGQVLGCGAYLKGLRRTKIGEFGVEEGEKIDGY